MTYESNLETVSKSLIGELTNEGIFAAGGQLAVDINGDCAVDIGVGEAGGGPGMTPDCLHNVYCIFKPMSYLLLAYVLENNGFGPDEPLDRIVDLPPWVPKDLTYRQLASHDAALAEPTAYTWRSTPPDERQVLLNRISGNLGPAYSDISGGLVIEHIIEYLTKQPPTQFCTEVLLEPLGLSDDIFFGGQSALAARSRIRVPIIGLPVDPLPMLTELLPTRICEARLALGVFATMRSMTRLYAAVGEVMDGNTQPGLPSPPLLQNLLDDDRPLRHDPILDRPAKWAAGLMTDLNLQGITKNAGPGTVGHTAGLANSVALHDPSRKASIAVYLNGVSVEDDDHIIPRQQLLKEVINAIPRS